MKSKLLYFLFSLICFATSKAQVSYGSVATYGLRKIIPTYTNSAIQVQRACDNATANIGFTSCGDLDTTTLKAFVLVPNPLSAITAVSAAAYGLRKLSCSYAGSAIQVRRSSDNSTANIGFTALGDLDTVTMKAFVGASSAFVSIWYDQSGNGRDASQGTNGNQPRIMNAGVIDRQNTKPAIYFSGVAIFLTASTLTGVLATTSGNITTANIVFQSNNSVNGTILSNGDGGGNRYNIHTPWGDNNTYWDIGNIGAGGRINTGLTWSSLSVGTFMRNGAQGDVWKNGTNSLSSGAMSTNVTSALAMSIGGSAAYGSYMVGYISEMTIFPSALSTTERQFLEWTQAQYYSVAGPILGNLPAAVPNASVATWYDQSASGVNASPTVTTNEPLIMVAGVIQRNSTTVPAIKFNGAQKGLVANLPVTVYPITISALANTSGAATNGAFVKLGGIDNTALATSGVAIGVGAGGGNFDPPTGTSLICLKEWLVWCPSSPIVNYPSTPFAVELLQLAAGTMSAYLNGTVVPLTSSATAVAASITGSLYIGGYRNQNDRFPAVKESEVTIFNSQLNNTRRILLETNQAAYNTLTLSVNKYTPPTTISYNRYVLGIGRESGTDSVNSTRQSVGMGFTVSTAAGDFLKNDGDYMTAGINCPITASTNVTFLPAPILLRWDNDWYVNKTDIGANNGTMSFYFDFGDYNIGTSPGVASNYSLLARGSTVSNFSVVPGTIPSVVGDRVYFSLDASTIANTGYYTIGTINPPVSPLPIELLNFDASVCEKDVCIDWSTANELNNAYFSIERSGDAENWNEIKRVKGAGNSQRTLNYSAMDYEPLPGTSYYRLKQVDANTNFVYSKIDAVEFKDNLAVGIYPNPSTGYLNISNCKNYDKIYVADLLGRKVYSTEVSKESMSLDLNSLSAGEYFITLINSTTNKKYSSKIVIDKK